MTERLVVGDRIVPAGGAHENLRVGGAFWHEQSQRFGRSLRGLQERVGPVVVAIKTQGEMDFLEVARAGGQIVLAGRGAQVIAFHYCQDQDQSQHQDQFEQRKRAFGDCMGRHAHGDKKL